MNQKKRGLGRGLGELLGDAIPVTTERKQQDVQTLPIEQLQRGKYQPRKDMDPEKLKELADSIRAQGVIQPIVVRSVGVGYEIIAGERRWRAAQIAELTHVPVVMRELGDKEVMAIALIENIQREDLTSLEEAEALRRLQDEFELTHLEIAQAVGKSRTTVTNLLRLLELPNEVKSLLGRGQLEMGHARALLGLTENIQVQFAEKIVKQGLSVRAVEQLVKAQQQHKVPFEKNEDPDILRLKQMLSAKTGAKVEIAHQITGKGKLIFNYGTLEELDGIISKIT